MTPEERDELQKSIDQYEGLRSGPARHLARVRLVHRITQALPETLIFEDSTFYAMVSGLLSVFFKGSSMRIPVPVMEGFSDAGPLEHPVSWYCVQIPMDLLREAALHRGINPMIQEMAAEAFGTKGGKGRKGRKGPRGALPPKGGTDA